MIWQVLRTNLKSLLENNRFGLATIGIILVLRLLGSLQFLELLTLDRLQQIKIGESSDTLITLVGIDDSYLTSKDSTTIEYADLAELIKRILSYNPVIVGVDLVEDELAGEQNSQLIDLFNNNERLIAVERIRETSTPPFQGLSKTVVENRTGFNDFSLDDDGNVRRMFLGWKPEGKVFRESLALLLSKQYFQYTQNLGIENGVKDQGAMRFGNVEIPRLNLFSGGYQNETSIYGIQTLINFRVGLISLIKDTQPFRILLASDISERLIQEEDIKDKIVILGSLDSSGATTFSSAVLPRLTYKEDLLTGLELQGHATSQITSSVLGEERMLLRPLHLSLEYALIAIFGLIGISFKRTYKNTASSLVYLSAISFFTILFSYLSLSFRGLWLPLVPVLLVFTINGVIHIVIAQSEKRWQALVQERDRALAALKIERQTTIDHAFDTIHNGPLQTLANLMRLIRDDHIDKHDISTELKKLNQEIREVGKSLKQESISDEQLYIQVGQARLDLNTPLHELFYEIYRETLQRPFPGFQSLRIQARSLEPVMPENLTIECKRKLCRFFEETLCNVGKHAVGATKLTVTGKTVGQFYYLTIIDNGSGLKSLSAAVCKGRGTQIACDLEASLKGRFTRKSNYPKGVLCEFKWSLA